SVPSLKDSASLFTAVKGFWGSRSTPSTEVHAHTPKEKHAVLQKERPKTTTGKDETSSRQERENAKDAEISQLKNEFTKMKEENRRKIDDAVKKWKDDYRKLE